LSEIIDWGTQSAGKKFSRRQLFTTSDEIILTGSMDTNLERQFSSTNMAYFPSPTPDNRSKEIDKNPLQGSHNYLTIMKAHPGVLGGLGALALLTALHKLADLVPHKGPIENFLDPAERLVQPQIRSQRRPVEIRNTKVP
jgi:hypothetical protein